MEFSDIVSHENSSFSNPNHKRSLREKKPTLIEDLGYVDKDIKKKSKSPVLQEIYKKCEKALLKIKKNPNAEHYLSSTNEEVPTLSQIEKKIKQFNYSTFYQFALDLRKVWSYYFSNFNSNTDLYQRTLNMSSYSEEVLKEAESMQEEKSEIVELHKRVDKLSRDLREFKVTNPTSSGPVKKIDKGGPLDKPMTMQEKNTLGNNIRSLPPEQLKGIVNILSDSLVIDPKKRFFEFDIETLDNRKLRELEKYVKGCMKKPTNNTPKPTKPLGTDLTENEKIAQLKVILYIICRVILRLVHRALM
jgi:hypothetical protein